MSVVNFADNHTRNPQCNTHQKSAMAMRLELDNVKQGDSIVRFMCYLVSAVHRPHLQQTNAITVMSMKSSIHAPGAAYIPARYHV